MPVVDQLYTVAGLDGDDEFLSIVQRATVAADGSVGTFETLPSELPIKRGHSHQSPRHGAFVYSVAGANSVSGTMTSQTDSFMALLE